jgi:acyl-CoA dehydrogenase
MNVQETRIRNSAASDATEGLLLERGSLFQERTTAVATAAAAEAEEVDLEARFPKAAIDAARAQKLLGMQIPVEFGGFGATVHDIPRSASRSAAPAPPPP